MQLEGGKEGEEKVGVNGLPVLLSHWGRKSLGRPGCRGSPAVSLDPVQTSWCRPQGWATAVSGGEGHSSASSPMTTLGSPSRTGREGTGWACVSLAHQCQRQPAREPCPDLWVAPGSRYHPPPPHPSELAGAPTPQLPASLGPPLVDRGCLSQGQLESMHALPQLGGGWW